MTDNLERNVRTNFSILFEWPSCMTHSAWKAFVRSLKDRAYEKEELDRAWAWFKKGWEAANE